MEASRRRSTSPGESVRGSARRRFGSSTCAAGLSSRAPTSTWWRKKERIAARRRAIVVAAMPSARSCATYAARSSARAVAGERPPPDCICHAARCAKSRRYASTVRGASRAAERARNESTVLSTTFVLRDLWVGACPERPYEQQGQDRRGEEAEWEENPRA